MRIVLVSLAVIVAASALIPVLGARLEQPPIRFLNSPFPVVEGPNGNLVIFVSRCNDTDRIITTQVPRRLVNVDTGKVMTIEPTGGIIEPGCPTEVTGNIVVPSGTEAGTYYIEQFITFDGRFRSFTIRTRTGNFRVGTP